MVENAALTGVKEVKIMWKKIHLTLVVCIALVLFFSYYGLCSKRN